MAEQDAEGQVAPTEENGTAGANTSLVLTPKGPLVAPTSPTDLICGVDRNLIESFLLLVRDNYKRADMATFFLEQRSGVVNIQGITNVRDVLSHLVTLLSPDTPNDKRLEQIYNAEEHLRRAINEPYEIALNELMVRFSQLYEQYKVVALPIKEEYAALATAPNLKQIEEVLGRVRELNSSGRASKAKNLWTADWEEGVISFTEAYDLLSKLQESVQAYYHQAEKIARERQEVVTIQALQSEVGALRKEVKRESRVGQLFHLGGYFLAIVIAIVAAILAILLYYLT
jgi:hypothetical protein